MSYRAAASFVMGLVALTAAIATTTANTTAGPGQSPTAASSTTTVPPPTSATRLLPPPPTTEQPAPTAALPGTPPCNENDVGSGIRPELIFIGCATSADRLEDITWAKWSATAAYGLAEQYINNCIPNCADGTFTTAQLKVLLSNPGYFDGTFVFRTLSFTTATGPPQTLTVPGDSWGWVTSGG